MRLFIAINLNDKMKDFLSEAIRITFSGFGKFSLMKSERIGGKLIYSEIYGKNLN